MRTMYFAGVLLVLAACAVEKREAELNLDEVEVKNVHSPLLLSYESCEHLGDALKKSALDRMHAEMAIRLRQGPMLLKSDKDVVVMAPSMGGEPGSSLAGEIAPVEGVDFSGTNNQEKGVDEADIIKVDGKYFYILNKSNLEILAIPAVGELAHASTLSLLSPGRGLIVMDDKALVLTNEREDISYPSSVSHDLLDRADYYGDNLKVDTIDLSADRKDPKVIESHYFEGELLAARKIGNKVYLATYMEANIPHVTYYPNVNNDFYGKSENEQKRLWKAVIDDTIKSNENAIENFDFLSMVPVSLRKNGDKIERESIAADDCANTFGATDASSTGFLSLITFDPESLEKTLSMRRVRGNRSTVYASPKKFILASSEHQPWWYYGQEGLKDQTTIHQFDLGDDLEPEYKDSVRVPGTLHNSFSLSEHEGFLRVATTTAPQGRFWADVPSNPLDTSVPPMEENNLFVIGDRGGKLDILSSIEGLAPGEKIWSARFSKDKGFLVTFRQVDPLFTLDLSDPLQPKVAGELKVPGVSNYLQDIGNDRLLAIGYGGDEDGLDFQTTISLFDTSDFNNPKVADSLSFAITEGLDSSWSRVSSEANSDHLAINYFSPVAMTAIPLNTERYVGNPLDPSGGEFEYISKLTLVNTAADKKLSIHGSVDHSQFYNKRQSPYLSDPQIRRSYFMGDYIYAISSKAVTATRLSDMSTTGSYVLP